MRWLAIINPRADHHTKRQLLLLAKTLRRKMGIAAIWTTHPNEAQAIVADHPQYDGYVAVGGDGTVAEVVNALDEKRQSVGIIPAGTANDLAHGLHLDSEAAALRALARQRPRRLDYVAVRFHEPSGWRDWKMISLSALGYVAETTALYQRPCKSRKLGSYAVAAFLQCFRQREFTARLRLDQGPWRELTLTNLVVQNTQCAGGFRLFPEARLDDGQLNVLHGRLSTFQQLLEDLGILTGTSICQRSIRSKARQVDVELPEPAMFMVDGDLYRGVNAVSYAVSPGGLSCLQ